MPGPLQCHRHHLANGYFILNQQNGCHRHNPLCLNLIAFQYKDNEIAEL